MKFSASSVIAITDLDISDIYPFPQKNALPITDQKKSQYFNLVFAVGKKTEQNSAMFGYFGILSQIRHVKNVLIASFNSSGQSTVVLRQGVNVYGT